MRRCSFPVKLRITSPKISEFGTMTWTLSGVSSTVEKMPTSRTLPLVPATSTKSPTRKKRKTSNSTPPAKLDRVPWRASPIARPMAPSTATREAVGTPKIPRVAMITKPRVNQ